MIIAEPKSMTEIMHNIESYSKVLVLGCRGCVGICSTGGDKEVEIVAEAIRLGRERADKPIEVLTASLIRQCEPEYLQALVKYVPEVEAVVSLGCGVGVNLIADTYPQLTVLPGVNTTFFGANVRPGVWVEMCRGCGDCILDRTAGLCPIARCAKNLLNGPCGGSNHGKCELRPDLDCIWDKIVKRLKERNELDKLETIWAPKDWRPAGGFGARIMQRDDLQVEG